MKLFQDVRKLCAVYTFEVLRSHMERLHFTSIRIMNIETPITLFNFNRHKKGNEIIKKKKFN